VAGPRSTSLLSSLGLSSADARARRGRVLIGLSLDVSADYAAVLESVGVVDGQPLTAMGRPPPLYTHDNGESGTTYRSTLSTGYGVKDTLVPDALDRALALQALDAFRPLDTDDFSNRGAIFDAIRFLLEFGINGELRGDGTRPVSWPLVRDGEAGGTGPESDLVVTAEVYPRLRKAAAASRPEIRGRALTPRYR
jgi:hypothetical protein